MKLSKDLARINPKNYGYSNVLTLKELDDLKKNVGRHRIAKDFVTRNLKSLHHFGQDF